MQHELLACMSMAIAGMVFALGLIIWILRKPAGTPLMKELSDTIYQGAMTFLNSEYRIISVYALIMALILWAFKGFETSVCFVVGALLSALAGNVGMRVATKSNARTAEAARRGIGRGLKLAFSSGTVMGMCVVGFGLFGISLMYHLVGDPKMLVGFGFGASSIALFARVGGGIFTKSADMGADLVGKVEARIPEDDPRNPAVIADNVGDNVGDVAGMGADLFESYVGSIISAMVIGVGGVTLGGAMIAEEKAVLFPLMLAGVGILSSILAWSFVRSTGRASIGALHSALNRGVFGCTILVGILAFLLSYWYLGKVEVFFSVLSGLLAGIVIGLSAEYFTESRFPPVLSIAKAATTGPATTIVSGFSMGMLSTAIPVVAVVVAIGVSWYFSELYGIAVAAVGMLSTLGTTLAADTYGPVADNAAGIAEMAHMRPEVRRRAEKLDAVGNTTAAIGKGFAIGSAALTALALFTAFTEQGEGVTLALTDHVVLIGIFIGAVLPFVFCALTMRAVSSGASLIVMEVRKQFKSIKGLMEGKAKPDYNKCIRISTNAALKNMAPPAIMAVAAPLVVGLSLGPECVGGLLAGAIVTGFLLAVTLANSGGAWDNAKKYIEEGNLGGKGSEAHAAAVIGDTVGDPFKDTSGPSLNILIKLMSMVTLLFASLII